MSSNKLTNSQYDIIYGVNPQLHLANFSDCIVVGDKDLDAITAEVQKKYEEAQIAVEEFLLSVSSTIKSIDMASEEKKTVENVEDKKVETTK